MKKIENAVLIWNRFSDESVQDCTELILKFIDFDCPISKYQAVSIYVFLKFSTDHESFSFLLRLGNNLVLYDKQLDRKYTPLRLNSETSIKLMTNITYIERSKFDWNSFVRFFSKTECFPKLKILSFEMTHFPIFVLYKYHTKTMNQFESYISRFQFIFAKQTMKFETRFLVVHIFFKYRVNITDRNL